MNHADIVSWLMEGDPAIQYQTCRDLLGKERVKIRKRIAREGWGLRFLQRQKATGEWGNGFYSPKWTSTHYTLLDLRNLSISPTLKQAQQAVKKILTTRKSDDGGINLSLTVHHTDVCVNGMVLNYATFFRAKKESLKSIVDFLLNEHMPDGGFNCRSNREGATHSSLHSTLSVIEGIFGYQQNGYRYRLQELLKAERAAVEFILIHKLFRSHRTGHIIREDFLNFHFPCRWYYDVLRALDYFQARRLKYDPRMEEALNVVLKKRGRDGRWKLASKHPGKIHFEMEKAGVPSRWNTLRAMRVLKHFGIEAEK